MTTDDIDQLEAAMADDALLVAEMRRQGSDIIKWLREIDSIDPVRLQEVLILDRDEASDVPVSMGPAVGPVVSAISAVIGNFQARSEPPSNARAESA